MLVNVLFRFCLNDMMNFNAAEGCLSHFKSSTLRHFHYTVQTIFIQISLFYMLYCLLYVLPQNINAIFLSLILWYRDAKLFFFAIEMSNCLCCLWRQKPESKLDVFFNVRCCICRGSGERQAPKETRYCVF